MRVAGAYCEFVAIPERNLVTIPDSFDMVNASLAEPAACSLHTLNRARMQSPRPLAELRALVIGGGAIGMLSALLLISYGCRQVMVSETNKLRREMVARSTGCAVHDPSADPELGADSFELVIDAVGGGITRALGSRVIAPGGIFDPSFRQNPLSLPDTIIQVQQTKSCPVPRCGPCIGRYHKGS